MKVFLGELDRFGYALTCVGNTEEECVKALMKEYTRAYKQRNEGMTPGKCFSYEDDKSDYAIAKEEIYVRELSTGEVEWH